MGQILQVTHWFVVGTRVLSEMIFYKETSTNGKFVSEGSVENVTKSHIHEFYLLGAVNVYAPRLQTKLEKLKTRIYRGACKSAHDISRNCVRSLRLG
jgi:hypothetical protein